MVCAVATKACFAADSPFSVTTAQTATQWTVSHRGKPVLVYSSDPQKFKPYVKELHAIGGKNVLRDAPHDHLHHHALMYGITVNGVNFWEETAGSGVQRVIHTVPPEAGETSKGLPMVSLRQEIMWLPAQSAFLPVSNAPALLLENRTLRLVANEFSGEVLWEWNSSFEVPPSVTNVVLTGAAYHGLGMRFAPELDATADHFFPEGFPDLSGTKQDVSSHDWEAIRFKRSSSPFMIAVIGHPQNRPAKPSFFSMARPFAYLAATQGLHAAPMVYKPGDKFELRYLVLLWSDLRDATVVHARAKAWWQQGL